VHLTTFSPPAIIGDLALIFLCYRATEHWDQESHKLAIQALLWWMFVSKFIKLMGHYIRYPVDFVFLPVSILFGYFHGLIKVYAATTLNVVSSSLYPDFSLELVRAVPPRSTIGSCASFKFPHHQPPTSTCLLTALSFHVSMSVVIKPFFLALPHKCPNWPHVTCSLLPSPLFLIIYTFTIDIHVLVPRTISLLEFLDYPGLLTFFQTAWGSRDGADANDAERMRLRTDFELDEKRQC
jgi:hypothetical protein